MLVAMATPSPDQRRRDLARVALAYAAALAAALAVGWALRDRHPIFVAAAADLIATLVVFIFSMRHDNSSLYDPYWSVAPLPIVLYWAAAGTCGLPQLLLLALVALWGVRLTANWVARWRGMVDEDFRYVAAPAACTGPPASCRFTSCQPCGFSSACCRCIPLWLGRAPSRRCSWWV